MPGCQLGPGLPPFPGAMFPKSCECIRQAIRFFKCEPQVGLMMMGARVGTAQPRRRRRHLRHGGSARACCSCAYQRMMTPTSVITSCHRCVAAHMRA